MLTVFLPAYFLFVFWQERKSIREIRYRERLFDVLSTNVDEVFLIYNQEMGAMEYVSANSKRVLDVEEDGFIYDTELLLDRVDPEDRAAFADFLKPAGTDARKSEKLRLRFPSGETRWILVQSFPEIVNHKVVRYIISISDQTEDCLLYTSVSSAPQGFPQIRAHLGFRHKYVENIDSRIQGSVNYRLNLPVLHSLQVLAAQAYLADQQAAFS